MKRFIESEDHVQGTLLPELLDDHVAEDNPVRVVDVFVEGLGLALLGFLHGCNQQRGAGQLTVWPCSSSSTSMVTSTASNRSVGSSAKRSAMSS
jgi:hypothetical protein